MGKEYPWFKFTAHDWLLKKIADQSYETKGIFIDLCAVYWHKKGVFSSEDLKEKFGAKANVLIEKELIKITQKGVEISFLKTQLKGKFKNSAKNKLNGLKGGRPKSALPKEEKPTGLFSETEKKPNTKAIREEREKRREEKKERLSIVAKTPPPEYQPCLDFWLKEYHVGWTFTGVQGKALKSIIKKLKKILKDSGDQDTPERVIPLFKKMCTLLPEWFREKDLNVIDQKFNEIIQEIKNGKPSRNSNKIGRNTVAEIHDFIYGPISPVGE
jgi:hypothetical protein